MEQSLQQQQQQQQYHPKGKKLQKFNRQQNNTDPIIN
jgi:hypothetical protein